MVFLLRNPAGNFPELRAVGARRIGVVGAETRRIAAFPWNRRIVCGMILSRIKDPVQRMEKELPILQRTHGNNLSV